MNKQELAEHIGAFLFSFGGPVSKKELAKKFAASGEEVAEAVASLKETSSWGIVLVDDGGEVELRTAPQVAERIETLRKEELSRDIGRAGLEVLSAVLYRGPLSRSDIDFIRGVNSSQTLRTLLMRGFVRKVPNPRDERSFLYEPTTEILSELGAPSPNMLPEYETIRATLRELEESYKAKEEQES